VHAVESVEGAFDVLILCIDVETIAALEQSDEGTWRDGSSFKGPLTRDRASVRAFRALATSLRDHTASGLLVEENVLLTLEALSRAYVGSAPATDGSPSEDERGVGRAREMLDDLYTESLSLDALALESGLPKPRFLRAFKRLIGNPPHAYQVYRRVDHARRMLAAGAPIADAANAAGFFDQSHLHRHFLRVMGLTPAAYRGSGLTDSLCKNVQEGPHRLP
jgi:AraC-like DNA-binding protein